MATDYSQDFEDQDLGVFDSTSNPTRLTFVTGRTSGTGFRVAEDGITATYAYQIVTSSQVRLAVVWIKSTVNPAADSGCFGFYTSAGVRMARIYIRSSGILRADLGTGGVGGVGTTVVTDGNWHRVDMWLDSSTTTWTLDWRLDGVAQTQVTLAGVATNSARITYGSATALHTADVTFDDALGSVTASDYPIGSQTITPGLISQVPTIFTHRVQNRITGLALISHTASPFTPSKLNLQVTSKSAFQADAFQNDAFQIGLDQLRADHTPSLYTPTLRMNVLPPSPLGGDEGFQADAFQADAFQMSAGSTGITHAPTPFSVVSITQGAETVFAGFISVPPTLSAPTLNQAIPASPQTVSFELGGGWDSPEITWDSTITVWDQVGGSDAIASHTPQVFAPSVNQSIATDLISHTPTLTAPTMNGATIFMPFINVPVVVFAPDANSAVAPDLLDATPVLYDPTLPYTQAVTPDLLDATPTLYAPHVNDQFLEAPLITSAVVLVFATTINQSVAPSLLDATPVVYAPFIGTIIYTDLIDHSPILFFPSLFQVEPDLLDATPVLYEPFINLPFAQLVRVDQEFVDVSAVLFDIDSIVIAAPKAVNVAIIIQAPQSFTPRIAAPTRPVIRLRARYEPVIRNRARYDPVIRNRAMVSQQG